jgi:phage shock protein A
MKKVPEQEWQDLQDELETLKEEHEDIICHHKKLLEKYDAIKAKRGAMSQQQRDGLEAQVKELRG